MTNSAQGVDYPSQPSLWLASRSHPGSCSAPPNTHIPIPRRALGTAPPNPPPLMPGSAAAEKRRQRARCHVGIGSWDAAAACTTSWSPRTPCPRAAREPRRSQEQGCAPSLPLGSPRAGTPGHSKASGAGLSRDRPS